MHARAVEPRAYPTVGARPSSPNMWGMTAVRPASATVPAKPATAGVMPGNSEMTITAGPDPVR